MAACLVAAAPILPSLANTIFLHLLLESRIAATSTSRPQAFRHPQTLSSDQTSVSPTDVVLPGLRPRNGWAVESQLMSWVMVQLLALGAFLGLLYVWWKYRSWEEFRATLQTSAAVHATRVENDTGAAAVGYKGSTTGKRSPSQLICTSSCTCNPQRMLTSIQDAQLTDPGLLRKHSSHRSYTTSFGEYPAIRVFKREHPQAEKLPCKPTPLPLLVFFHGLGGSLAQFHPLITSLCNVAPCLGIDLPGCGLSRFAPTKWDAYSQEALVKLLATVIADFGQRHPSQGVVLIGHSMGCSLAALLASSDSPLRKRNIDVLGLIGICPKAVPPTQHQLALFRRLLSLPTPLLNLWRRWDRRGGPESVSVARFVGPGADAETKRLQERFNTQSISAVWRRMAWGLYFEQMNLEGTASHIAGLEVWARLSLPIFLVAGESDTITSPEEVAAIGRALGKTEQLVSAESSAPVPLPGAQSSNEQAIADAASEMTKRPRSKKGTDAKSNTETIILADHDRSLDETFVNTASFPQRQRVLKTSILPAPAAHSLLYDPTTYRTLAGLIQEFLWDHIDSRLSLGWQLQHLSTEGKWDVKNLAKWEAVRPVSEPIAGVFRAMKTLRAIDDAHCPEKFVWNWRGKLKAVVDISYENPVYDPRGLEDGGIEYHKFPTVSKIPPTTEEVQEFIRLIDRIRQTESSTAAADALIGVHCHYGFNRTGFFICSYLVEREHYSVQQAIDEFQRQRPPGIRHEHFLDTLFVRRSGTALG